MCTTLAHTLSSLIPAAEEDSGARRYMSWWRGGWAMTHACSPRPDPEVHLSTMSPLLWGRENLCFAASLSSLAPSAGLASASPPSVQRRLCPMFSVPPCVARTKCSSKRRVLGVAALWGNLTALAIQMFFRAPPGAKSFFQISRNAHYQPNHLPLGRKCVSAVEAPPGPRPPPLPPPPPPPPPSLLDGVGSGS